MADIAAKIRDVAKGLLADGKVDLVIGYEKGTLPLRSRPCFVRDAGDTDGFVWDAFCSNNLAVYLPGLFERPPNLRGEFHPPKVAVAAKGCDGRSIIGLLKEHQIPREKVVVIGIPCRGVVDVGKVVSALEGAGVSACEDTNGGTVKITTTDGKKRELKAEDIIADSCLECVQAVPPDSDVSIEGDARTSPETRYLAVKDFEAKTAEERWEYFTSEISRCIRCYACRQACPNCYCKTCFVDQSKPRWVGAGDNPTDVLLYHIGRIFHQAGRCVECDACVRACPMGIDLRLFTRKLGKDIEELFEYVPGMSSEELPPLCTFDEGDSESFITEP